MVTGEFVEGISPVPCRADDLLAAAPLTSERAFGGYGAQPDAVSKLRRTCVRNRSARGVKAW